MFIVFLKFSENKSKAKEFMSEHNTWLQSGVTDGIFHLAGGFGSGDGGVIIASGLSEEELESRVSKDPFVRENIVLPEIVSVKPSVVTEQLSFLKV